MADQKAEIFELNNGSIKVRVSNFGCTITSLTLPGKDGKSVDVVLGFDSVEPYLKGMTLYFGCIVGRVANRIKEGKFTLNGTQHSLPINNPPNNLHGYPGSVSVTATYTLTSSTTMRLDMEAVPENKPTLISLAHHTYWNLAGHNSGDILDHIVQISSNHITSVDKFSIPTGEIKPVKDTPFDFIAEMRVGKSIHEVDGLGYDHNYVLNCRKEKEGLKHAAKVRDSSNSRVLNRWTDAPGMKFYTGNYVDGVRGK